MNQTLLIITIALMAGLGAAWATWLSFDFSAVLGGWLSARRERKRIASEAKSLKAAEAKAEEK